MRARTLGGWVLAGAMALLLGLGAWFAVGAHRARVLEAKKRELYPQIRVEVLNAAGVQGLAKRVSWYLRGEGFDVVYYGNARDTLPKTVIIERADSSMGNARELAALIGCRELTYAPDPDNFAHITLVVGLDYERLFPGVDTIRPKF